MNLPPLPLNTLWDRDGTPDGTEYWNADQMQAYAHDTWNAALEAAAKAVIGDASKAAIRALRMK